MTLNVLLPFIFDFVAPLFSFPWGFFCCCFLLRLVSRVLFLSLFHALLCLLRCLCNAVVDCGTPLIPGSPLKNSALSAVAVGTGTSRHLFFRCTYTHIAHISQTPFHYLLGILFHSVLFFLLFVSPNLISLWCSCFLSHPILAFTGPTNLLLKCVYLSVLSYINILQVEHRNIHWNGLLDSSWRRQAITIKCQTPIR